MSCQENDALQPMHGQRLIKRAAAILYERMTEKRKRPLHLAGPLGISNHFVEIQEGDGGSVLQLCGVVSLRMHGCKLFTHMCAVGLIRHAEPAFVRRAQLHAQLFPGNQITHQGRQLIFPLAFVGRKLR